MSVWHQPSPYKVHMHVGNAQSSKHHSDAGLSSLLSIAVGQECILHALNLPRGELVHAGIIRVVHKVVNGVFAGAGAGVAALGAAKGS